MPRKLKINFRDPKTGKVEKVEIPAVHAKDAAKRVPWEYSFTDQFADRPKNAPDPHATPEVTPLDHRQTPLPVAKEPVTPVAKPKDEKSKAKEPNADLAALRAEYHKVVGKKAPGFFKADKLQAAIDKAKAENSSAGGGAQSGSGNA